MVVFFIAYIISVVITSIMVEKFKYCIKPFPKLKINKFGIKFFSLAKHRLKIAENKIMFIGENVYLKTPKNMIVFKNIKNLKCKNDYMYFTACGNVEIAFDCGEVYKYFNLLIKSRGLDFDNLKQVALLDLINNNFNFQEAKKFNNFLNFLKNTLKININNKKITISSNKLQLSYQLMYKVGNKIKKINVENTIGKN